MIRNYGLPTKKISTRILERIAFGLERRCIVECSQWAEKYRVMGPPIPGAWTFKYHPWLKDFHDCNHSQVVIMKNAQGGWSESVLNKSLFNIDIKGLSVLYILPSATPDAKDFSSSRFNPALELSPHLRNMFSDVNNVGVKLAGNACLYVRGSRSRGGLKSVPTAVIIQDEYDEHDMSLAALAEKRSDGQLEGQRQNIKLSTPTISDFGIHAKYLNSSKDHFFFKCPHCSKSTELIFPESLVITGDNLDDPKLKDSHYICKECKGKLDHETKYSWLSDNEWVSQNSLCDVKGYYINQLYSSNISPYELSRRYLKGLTDPFEEQEFFNSSLGLPHIAKGAKLTIDQIESSRGPHFCGLSKEKRLTCMGVDVGHEELYVEISEYWNHGKGTSGDINSDTYCRVLDAIKIKGGGAEGFSILKDLMLEYNVFSCVIDVDPETRLATEFYNIFPDKVKLCQFSRGAKGRTLVPDERVHIVQVHRTSWLDQALGRFRTHHISIPQNLNNEYTSHMTAPTKIYKTGPDGNLSSKYVNANKDDHFAFARVYCEVALGVVTLKSENENIQGVI